jgi:DNA polymerase-3 subunit alpha
LKKEQLNKLPGDIDTTYQLFKAGNLEGIFQLESDGMRQIVKDLKPTELEDISSILALYRPGPLDAGLIPMYIDRKHGREDVKYDHPILQPILKETYGIIVYQEQIMKIAQDLAGYSLGEADLLRRAMGKKKTSEMKKHRTKFL